MTQLTKFIRPYRVEHGARFKLSRIDPGDTGGLDPASKDDARVLLRESVERLAALQDKLYAQDRWSVLLIFQAMDAAGKDGAIKHVMSGVNPQGCEVSSFKAPTVHELDHDFMWRTLNRLPSRGTIGIFNRSYYEEVLIARVNPGILQGQKLPPRLVGKRIWDERFEDIRAIEKYLSRNGVLIRKFFLHVSKKEQKKRLLDRLDHSEKNWKFSIEDVKTRTKWKDYMRCYQDAVRETASKDAPWFVIPADNKWFTRMVVAAAVIEGLESLDLQYPTVTPAQQEMLAEGRLALETP